MTAVLRQNPSGLTGADKVRVCNFMHMFFNALNNTPVALLMHILFCRLLLQLLGLLLLKRSPSISYIVGQY
jgi:hypothetical protein